MSQEVKNNIKNENNKEYFSTLLVKFPSLLYIEEYQKRKDVCNLYLSPNLDETDRDDLIINLLEYFNKESQQKNNIRIIIKGDISIIFYYNIEIKCLLKIIYSYRKIYNPTLEKLGIYINNLSDIYEKYNSLDRIIESKNTTINYKFLISLLKDNWSVSFELKEGDLIFFSTLKQQQKCGHCAKKAQINIGSSKRKSVFSCKKKECLFNNGFELDFCCFDLGDDLGLSITPPSPLSLQSLERVVEYDKISNCYISSPEFSGEEEYMDTNVRSEYVA